MVLRSGLVRQSVRFARDRHIVSRDNVIYSEILRIRRELFRDCVSGQNILKISVSCGNRGEMQRNRCGPVHGLTKTPHNSRQNYAEFGAIIPRN